MKQYMLNLAKHDHDTVGVNKIIVAKSVEEAMKLAFEKYPQYNPALTTLKWYRIVV